jgi:uncharacterized protein YdeI (YjbR/CyaY-like superfamily)
MKTPVKTVDEYIATKPEWAEALEKLRAIMLACQLEEGIKWGSPAYMINGRNVAGLVAFKQHIAIWFWQGALLQDPDGVLVNAQEGKTQALRQWRFANAKAIKPALIKKYVLEAKTNALAGKAVELKKKETPTPPAEMVAAFEKDKALANAFQKLSPGCQREYVEYVAEAKLPATRERRMAKSAGMILAGKGLS